MTSNSRTQKILAPNNGFTLIEVLIAIAIFSIGILAVASLQTDALGVTRSSRITTECLTLATQHAERLMALPIYPDPNDFSQQSPELVQGNHTENDNLSVPPRYQIQWTVQDDIPIGQQQPPGAPNNITISKTIGIQVSPINNPNDIRANLEFIKIWSAN